MSGLLNIQAGASVAMASQAEAEAGTNAVKVMSPLRTAQAIAALGGGGGWSVQQLAYVDGGYAEGSSDGSPSAPYSTIQAAFNAGFRNFVVIGAAGGLDLRGEADGAYAIGLMGTGFYTIGGGSRVGAILLRDKQTIVILGSGRDTIRINSVETRGRHGDDGTSAPWMGDIVICGANVGFVESIGGNGGSAAATPGANGGDGSPSSQLFLRDCAVSGITLSGGSGGAGGPGYDSYDDGYNGGDGGAGGAGVGSSAFRLEYCTVEYISCFAGEGGAGGVGGQAFGGGMPGIAGSAGGNGYPMAGDVWFSSVNALVGADANYYAAVIDGTFHGN